MPLNYRFENKADTEVVYFSGDVNEDAEVTLGELKDKLTGKMIFNLKNLGSINSCGVRAWVNFMRNAAKSKISFEDCPPEVISQINMIPNFKAHAEISSLYGAYVCESCGHHKLHLFKKGENLPASLDAPLPGVTCDKCSKMMEMEELEEEFFSWLQAS